MQTPIKNGKRADLSGSKTKTHRKLKLLPESAKNLKEINKAYDLDGLPLINAQPGSINVGDSLQYNTEVEIGHDSVMSTLKKVKHQKPDIANQIYQSHIFSQKQSIDAQKNRIKGLMIDAPNFKKQRHSAVIELTQNQFTKNLNHDEILSPTSFISNRELKQQKRNNSQFDQNNNYNAFLPSISSVKNNSAYQSDSQVTKKQTNTKNKNATAHPNTRAQQFDQSVAYNPDYNYDGSIMMKHQIKTQKRNMQNQSLKTERIAIKEETPLQIKTIKKKKSKRQESPERNYEAPSDPNDQDQETRPSISASKKNAKTKVYKIQMNDIRVNQEGKKVLQQHQVKYAANMRSSPSTPGREEQQKLETQAKQPSKKKPKQKVSESKLGDYLIDQIEENVMGEENCSPFMPRERFFSNDAPASSIRLQEMTGDESFQIQKRNLSSSISSPEIKKKEIYQTEQVIQVKNDKMPTSPPLLKQMKRRASRRVNVHKRLSKSMVSLDEDEESDQGDDQIQQPQTSIPNKNEKKTIYIDFSNASVSPQKPLRVIHNEVPKKVAVKGGQNFVKPSQFDIMANIQNQGITIRNGLPPTNQKLFRPSKLVIDVNPLGANSKNFQASGVGLIGIGPIKGETSQQIPRQGQTSKQPTRVKLLTPHGSSTNLGHKALNINMGQNIQITDEIQQLATCLSQDSSRSNSKSRSISSKRKRPEQFISAEMNIKEISTQKPNLLPPSGALRNKLKQHSNKNMKQNNILPQKAGNQIQSSNNLISAIPKKKKGKIAFERQYVAADSSEASDGTKELVLGQDIGKKLKVLNQTFCKDYLTEQQFLKYKDNFSKAKYKSQIIKDGKKQGFTSSERVVIAKDFVEKFFQRRHLPILIINLDGVFGIWDYQKEIFVIRIRALESLTILSQDFTLIGISNQKKSSIKKLLFQLQKISICDNHNVYPQTFTHKNIVFDAVYQIKSHICRSELKSTNMNCLENNENNFVDEIQNDLTQIFVDLRLYNNVLEKVGKFSARLHGIDKSSYDPLQKVIICTTRKYSLQNLCYSFDYNHYFQMTKPRSKRRMYQSIPDPESIQFSPIIIQVPHMRINHRISFDVIHVVIFVLTNLAYQNSKNVIKNTIIKNRLKRELIKRQQQGKTKSMPMSESESESAHSEEEKPPRIQQIQQEQEPQQNAIQRENQKMLEDKILEEIDEKLEETNELRKLINIPQTRIIKKLLCANYSKLQRRLKLQRLYTHRIFDHLQTNSHLYLMQSIDFFWAYKKLKFNLNTKLQKNDILFDWLKLKSFKLNLRPPELVSKDIDSTYISNINSKHQKELDEWDAKMAVVEREDAIKDSKSKAPRRGPTLQTHYTGCDEAKNLYNMLIIQNRRMVNEINTYKNLYKEHKKQRDALLPKKQPKVTAKMSTAIKPKTEETNEETPEQVQEEEKVDDSPINPNVTPLANLMDQVEIKIISDTPPDQEIPAEPIADPDQEIAPEEPEEESDSEEQFQTFVVQKKPKNYQTKYRVIQIKGNEVGDNEIDRTFTTQQGEMDLKQFTLISLKKEIYEQLCSDIPIDKDDQNQIFMNINKQKANKNFLVDLLATKQRLIPYSTSQDMHLQNNLSQLVGGEQQYYDMLYQLQGEDKDKKQRQNDDELK